MLRLPNLLAAAEAEQAAATLRVVVTDPVVDPGVVAFNTEED